MTEYLRGKKKKTDSPAGNRTRVFRVTGGDTYHYTTEEIGEWKFAIYFIYTSCQSTYPHKC